MSSVEPNATLKRLKSRYRFVIINDDTFEEVVTFKLTRSSVYVTFSMLFVLLIGLTVALLVLTPLKFYIPGYGKKSNQRQLQVLKLRTDSLERAIHYKEQYLKNVQTILSGGEPQQIDTTALEIPQYEVTND